MRITQNLPRFFQWLQFNRNVNLKTVDFYKGIMLKFVADMGDWKINHIKIENIWQWREILNNRKVQLQSQRHYLLALRVFLKFCREEKLTNIDISQITLPKKPPKEVLYLENGEVKRFVETIKSLKYRTIVEVLLGTGMRISELLSLTRADIKDGETKIVGKNEKERIIYFSDRALYWLGKYLKKRKDKEPALFVSNEGRRLARGTVENFFLAHRKKIGFEKPVTPHTLRHTTATNMIMNGADIFFVKDFLGHSDIKTTAAFYLGKNESKIKETQQKYLNYDN